MNNIDRQAIIQVNLLMPFLATLGASLTVISLQFIAKYVSNVQKKLYAVTCIADISFRVLYSELFLKKKTIMPHIEATKKIISGDNNLIETMFLADEFDILTDEPFDFGMLSEEHKILLGIDDIDLIQSYEFIVYSSKNSVSTKTFNEFVRNNLKSRHSFGQKSHDAQRDILSTYWDYLDKIMHEADRSICFIIYLMLPRLKEYTKRAQFSLLPHRSVQRKLKSIEEVIGNFKDIIPDKSFFEKINSGGIQKII